MKKVLVVDDEVGIRESIKRILGRQGFDVITASNGEDAFKIIRKQDIDLLITDIRMAGMEWIRQLKQ